MSSLAATQADGYYYPAEWRPEHGSLTQFRQSKQAQAQGRRVQHKHVEGDGKAPVVRFEMPFHVWCTHCDVHIGRGVRFNAEKRCVGRYFSSTVWEFVMRCATCSGQLVIRTDPKERSYELVSGVEKKAEAEDAREMETELLNDAKVAQKLRTDPFFRLEHENEDKRVARKRSRGLDALVQLQSAQFKDDYASNSALRAQFRSDKKKQKRREEEATRLGIGGIPLVDVHLDDVVVSRTIAFKGIPHKRRAVQVMRGSEKARSMCARAAAADEKADSFQYFGDPLGSKLRCMQAAKRSAKKRAATLSRT
uniref:Coiled-coil domain-containing protein 130 n=1 Tax=Peronospora matthiolae TaxID=2874970 RepID=A0AAV1UAA1_9STRA